MWYLWVKLVYFIDKYVIKEIMIEFKQREKRYIYDRIYWILKFIRIDGIVRLMYRNGSRYRRGPRLKVFSIHLPKNIGNCIQTLRVAWKISPWSVLSGHDWLSKHIYLFDLVGLRWLNISWIFSWLWYTTELYFWLYLEFTDISCFKCLY